MIQCQNCGQLNAPESNFCRSCGLRFGSQQTNAGGNDYEYSPPRPYSWKTDEFQVSKNEPRKVEQIKRVEPLGTQIHATNPGFGAQPLAYQQPQPLAHGYHCPRCGTTALPVIERRVSTAGWVVFTVLLIFTWIFFWIGLLMKEDVRVCPVCRARVS
jgi:RNA polymerase subunit RPABC4/transcription elongation factor Spt4